MCTTLFFSLFSEPCGVPTSLSAGTNCLRPEPSHTPLSALGSRTGTLAGGWTAYARVFAGGDTHTHTDISAVRRQFKMILLGLCYILIQHPAQQTCKGNQQMQLQPGFLIKNRRPCRRCTSWRGGDHCAQSNEDAPHLPHSQFSVGNPFPWRP